MLVNFPRITNKRIFRRHYGASHLRGEFYLLYYKDFPRAAYVVDGEDNECVKYFSDRSQFLLPAAWLIVTRDSGTRAFRYSNGSYRACSGSVDWHEVQKSKPVNLTPNCASVIIDQIFKDHKNWLSDPLSKAAIGSIPKIFSECTTLVYELIQNAFDANASRVRIELDEKGLRFFHDGYNFSESDAKAISFVNLSSKDKDKTGFMGIGFKSVFEASLKPEIHSEPFSFLFNNRSEGGYILPQNVSPKTVTPPFTTLIYVPFKEKRVCDLINKELTPEEEKDNKLGFSRKTFLHLLKEKNGILAGIRNVETPFVKFRIVRGKFPNSYRIEDLKEEKVIDRKPWLYFETRLRPEKGEVSDFLRARGIKNEELEEEGWDEILSIIIPLTQTNTGYAPVKGYAGILNVYLPTTIKTGFSFDLQGNFIISAGRERLRYATGKWNRELFSHVGELLVKIFDWCKSLKEISDIDLSAFYCLIPDWKSVDFVDREIIDDIRSRFTKFFNYLAIIPVGSEESKRITYRTAKDCVMVDGPVLDLFGKKTIEHLTGKKIVLPSLSMEAREKISESCDVDTWGVNETIKLISQKDWLKYSPKFKSRRHCHRWLSKLYAYLNSVPVQDRYDSDLANLEDRILNCFIFPTEWVEGEKQYKYSRCRAPREKLYRLPREQAALPVEAFLRKISIVNQGFEDYIRGRPSKMTDEEKAMAEASRNFLESIGVPTLEPDVIAKDFISPLFRNTSAHSKKVLLEYTSFICEHLKEVKKESIDILLLNKRGEFCIPDQLFLGDAYGFADIEEFLGRTNHDVFVSEQYLNKASISTSKWVEFLSSVGVKNWLPIKSIKETLGPHRLKERLGEHYKDFQDIPLRGSYISADFPGNRFLLIDGDFLDVVKCRLEEIRKMPLISKKDCMRAFLRIIDAHWESKYSKNLYVKVLYYKEYEPYYSSPHKRLISLKAKFAEYLIRERWVPATNSDDLREPSQVVAQTEENISLSDEGIVLCEEVVKNPDLLGFLKFKPIPENVTSLDRLVNLKTRGSENLDMYKKLYRLIAKDVEEKKLGTQDVVREFSDNKLIYINNSFWSPEETIFNPPAPLRLYYPAVIETYPDMKDFFCKTLGCDNDNPSIKKIIMYFLKFLWVTDRGMDDTLRASVVHCYRKLLDFVGEQENATYKEEPLWESFINDCKVFCRDIGWISSRTDKPIVFLDVPKHEEYFHRCKKIRIESHLSQLQRDTSDLVPLLELLNVKPASQAIKEDISSSGEGIHENTQQIEANLNFLAESIVDVLSRKYIDSTKKERTELKKFIEKLNDFKKYRKVVYHVDRIACKMYLDGEKLFDVNKSCHIEKEGGLLKILARDALGVIYGQLSGELCSFLGTAILPRSIKDVVHLMIDRTVGNIEGDFRRSMQNVYRDIGFDTTHDEKAEDLEEEEDADETEEVDTGEEPQDSEGSQKHEKKPYDEVTDPVDFSGISLVTVIGSETTQHDQSGGGTRGHVGKRHFTPNPYSEEDGKRGEGIVLEKEKERLRNIALSDYVQKVVHISETKPGNPWDIESFDKRTDTGEVIPIRIEVKATPDEHSLVFPMSEPEFRAALDTKSPKGTYFIYRVFSVRSAKPSIKRYEFYELFQEKRISIKKAKDFYLELPISDEESSVEA
ncbi:MAG: DUF3883 domain-containing protein [Candidatus Aenigmarchaeota archaeon]|nr:DUF3883 domain-containing protein [Candidatus Aenigmarchaeota archaeon]